MVNHTAHDSGCIHVKLDEYYRQLGFNSEPYNFNDLQVYNCYAWNTGGGFFIDNIRKMEIKNSSIRENWAVKGSGGGIHY